MKKNLRALVLALLSLAALTPRFARADADNKNNTNAAEANADAKTADKKDEPRVTRDKNGNVCVKLDDETQKRIALKVDSVAASQYTPELKAYGAIVDPAPVVSLINDLAAAKAAYKASSNELARLQSLSGSGNASARALESAEAAALRDQLQVQSAHDKLMLGWGREIAGRDDLERFAQSLTTLDTVLVRINLAGGQRLDTAPAKARIAMLSGSHAEGELVGPAMGVDPQTQSAGYIYQIKQDSAKFLPGESVTAFLAVKGEPLAGIIVPREAIVRVDGKGWVYVESSENLFSRTEIPLDLPIESGWFVTNGVSATDKLVLSGAQEIYSEEVKPAGAPAD